ncbi:glutamate--tRNA ligase, partial [Dysgonomonas gadei]|uniref:glutamate--tRNA ligase n=1 Tax=Dysgonomonas gadei TaxID=156974 RepID=UPI003AF12A14
MSQKVRVRFAPSPTGPLHIGGVRTALYNYLFAKKHGGDFVLRIEDTDSQRFVPGAEEYIIEALTWLGLKFDEGTHVGGAYAPYRQSDRKEVYRKYVDVLLDEGAAYIAFDTPEELELKRAAVANFQYDASTRGEMRNSLTLSSEEVQALIDGGNQYVVRFKIEANQEVLVNDIIRGEVKYNSSVLDDKVLFKSADNLPTYHLANIVDDHLMEITHVIRGEEWLPSAPLHVLLYKAFGWEATMPQFAHLPLLLKPEGNGKLSKRDGDRLGFPVFPLEWKDPKTGEISSGYRESGYLPEAVINFLALLGWNPGNDQEIMSMDELVQLFSLEKCSKSGAKFDYEKGKWFNHQYIQLRPNAEIANIYYPILEEKGVDVTLGYVETVVGLVKERVSFVKELWDQSFFFFVAPVSYDEKVVKKRWKEDSPAQMAEL